MSEVFYEVWSITTGNRYGKTFEDEDSARRVFDVSCAMWPESEFALVRCSPDGSQEMIAPLREDAP